MGRDPGNFVEEALRFGVQDAETPKRSKSVGLAPLRIEIGVGTL
ncbi:hypothetical protein [Microvirga vignae]|nr:hypothetical protein [Microvirga vignae]